MADVNVTTTQTTSWLKTHETLIIVFLVLVVGGFLTYHFLDNQAKADSQKATIAAQQLEEKTKADAAALSTAQAAAKSYADALLQLTQQNATLSASIASRNTVLVKQQVTDKTLPPTQLVNRWSQLTGNSLDSFVVDTTDIKVSEDAAVNTVIQLEQIPTLKQNLADETTKEQNVESELTSANNLISDGKTVVANLQSEIDLTKKADAAELTAVKAQARKSKIKIFGIGFGIGFVAGLTAHIW